MHSPAYTAGTPKAIENSFNRLDLQDGLARLHQVSHPVAGTNFSGIVRFDEDLTDVADTKGHRSYTKSLLSCRQ